MLSHPPVLCWDGKFSLDSAPAGGIPSQNPASGQGIPFRFCACWEKPIPNSQICLGRELPLDSAPSGTIISQNPKSGENSLWILLLLGESHPKILNLGREFPLDSAPSGRIQSQNPKRCFRHKTPRMGCPGNGLGLSGMCWDDKGSTEGF